MLSKVSSKLLTLSGITGSRAIREIGSVPTLRNGVKLEHTKRRRCRCRRHFDREEERPKKKIIRRIQAVCYVSTPFDIDFDSSFDISSRWCRYKTKVVKE